MNKKILANFGDWCAYDPNLFCQEREGCRLCCKRPSKKDDQGAVFSTDRA
jgi:aconitase B